MHNWSKERTARRGLEAASQAPANGGAVQALRRVAILLALALCFSLVPSSAWAYTLEITDLDGYLLSGGEIDANELERGFILTAYDRPWGTRTAIIDENWNELNYRITGLEDVRGPDGKWIGGYSSWHIQVLNPIPDKTYILYFAALGEPMDLAHDQEVTMISFTARVGSDDDAESADEGSDDEAVVSEEVVGEIDIVPDAGEPSDITFEGDGQMAVEEGYQSDAEGEEGADPVTETTDDTALAEESSAVESSPSGEEGDASGADLPVDQAPSNPVDGNDDFNQEKAPQTNPSSQEQAAEEPQPQANDAQAQAQGGDEVAVETSRQNRSDEAVEATRQNDDVQDASQTSASSVKPNSEDVSKATDEIEKASQPTDAARVYHLAGTQSRGSAKNDSSMAGGMQLHVTGLPLRWLLLRILLVGALPCGIAIRRARFGWNAHTPTRLC